MLNMKFNQDRMQAKDTKHITDRSGINKLSLGCIQKYRKYLTVSNREKSLPSVDIIPVFRSKTPLNLNIASMKFGLLPRLNSIPKPLKKHKTAWHTIALC